MEYVDYITLRKQKHFQKELLRSQKSGVPTGQLRLDTSGGIRIRSNLRTN